MICKMGDIAFIKKAIREVNIDRIVTCKKHLGYFSKGDTIVISGEHYTAYDSDDYWIVEGNIETLYGQAREGVILDSWLFPINPDKLDAEDDLYNVLNDELTV